MDNTPNLTIIVPIFNEEESVNDIILSLNDICKKNNWSFIIINDGSTDNSKQIIEENHKSYTFKTIHHKLNKGYGAAIKSGIKESNSKYTITFDGDGQHQISDIEKLYKCLLKNDADMVVGSRKGTKSSSNYRGFGKVLIRTLAKILMNVPIYDINSGMKIFSTELAKKYLYLAPNTMSFSDIFTLIFINNRHMVIEEPIEIVQRKKGKSTITIETAFHTVMEIINIVILFNPAKIFLPLAFICFITGLGFGIPILIKGNGVSIGSLLGIFAGIMFFLLGLIAEQLSLIRRNKSN